MPLRLTVKERRTGTYETFSRKVQTRYFAPQRLRKIWDAIDAHVVVFTNAQFDTGGRPGKVVWRALAPSTVKKRTTRHGGTWYSQPSGEGPTSRMGVWTGKLMAHARDAKPRIRKSGMLYVKSTKFPRTVFFDHGTRQGQPERRIWPVDALTPKIAQVFRREFFR
jgi:hypothetical protein